MPTVLPRALRVGALDRVDRSELATATRLLTTVAADLRRQAVDLGVELSAQRTGG